MSAEEKLSPGYKVARHYEDGMAKSPGNEDSEMNRSDIYGKLESIENSTEQILSENVKLRSEFQEMKASMNSNERELKKLRESVRDEQHQ